MDDAEIDEFGDSVWMDPSELPVAAPFSTLIPIHPSTLAAVTESIRRDGFNRRRPIEVWRQANTVVDGHTRRQAAIDAGSQVWVTFLDFDSEDQAFDYACDSQIKRRNMTSGELACLIEAKDRRRRQGERTDLLSTDKKSEHSHIETARAVRVSPATVSRVRAVVDAKEEMPDVYDAMRASEISIREAERRVKKRKEASRPPKPEPARDGAKAEINASFEPTEAEAPEADTPFDTAMAFEAFEDHVRAEMSRWPEDDRPEFVFKTRSLAARLASELDMNIREVSYGS